MRLSIVPCLLLILPYVCGSTIRSQDGAFNRNMGVDATMDEATSMEMKTAMDETEDVDITDQVIPSLNNTESDVQTYQCPVQSQYLCNMHNIAFKCTCYYDKSEPLNYPTCDEVFILANIRAYVIEMHINLTVDPLDAEEFDTRLANLIEEHCSIDKKYLMLLRKSCEGDAMFVKLAFMSAIAYKEGPPITLTNLQIIHPNIFTNNIPFMKQRLLPIHNVTEIDFLTMVNRKTVNTLSFQRGTYWSVAKANMLFTFTSAVILLVLLVDVVGVIVFLNYHLHGRCRI